MTPELEKRLAEAIERVNKMTDEERAAMHKAQAESWARAEANWPPAKYRWENGVKIYESYADYCNG